jgi:chromosomal replication initiation ATPase DnaA
VLTRLSESETLLFKSWYAELKFVDKNSHSIILSAPSKFVAQYVQTHHLRPLLGAVQLEFGQIYKVCFAE